VIRHAIIELQRAGLSAPEIARQLGVAPTTVSYHLERLSGISSRQDPGAPPEPAQSKARTRDGVAQLLADGLSRVEIARRLLISKQTVSYHARRLGSTIDERCARRYDWSAVQRYYDQGHSVRDCVRAFGFSSASWSEAVKRGAITARPSATPIAELLVADTYRARNNVKLRLLKEGLKQPRCERCGLAEWNGAPLSLALHHINGDRLDNRLANLELLCPNCHSQTATYSGRNGHRRPKRAG
jgi:DNA-binding CsgD family transcriptional regulator